MCTEHLWKILLRRFQAEYLGPTLGCFNDRDPCWQRVLGLKKLIYIIVHCVILSNNILVFRRSLTLHRHCGDTSHSIAFEKIYNYMRFYAFSKLAWIICLSWLTKLFHVDNKGLGTALFLFSLCRLITCAWKKIALIFFRNCIQSQNDKFLSEPVYFDWHGFQNF